MISARCAPASRLRLPAAWRSPWLTLAFRIAEHLRCGVLAIETEDGARRVFEGQEAGPSGHLRLYRPRAIRRFATGGTLGFGEAYVAGDWGSPDLARLLYLLALNEAVYDRHRAGRFSVRLLPRLRHLLRANTRRGSRRNVVAHYDLGNAFYASWLDAGMTYSAACFDRPDQPLEEAQTAKFRSLARKIALEPSHDLLEIGCGWGSFAEFAAAEIGARVTAITTSKQQYAYAAERVQAAGLNDRVEIRLQDYREVRGRFARLVSIEMLEAVGERYWPVYFGQLCDRLAPGGLAGLQIITIDDGRFERYRRACDFIQRHVFPGGMLPSPEVIDAEVRRAGLVKVDEDRFGLDYARTLALWNRRFQDAWPRLLEQGLTERFRRLWELYLAYCEAGFRAGFTDVRQIVLRRP